MKRIAFLSFPVLFTAALAACGGGQRQVEAEPALSEFQVDAQRADGIQRMSTYFHADTIRVGSRTYTYSIEREAVDSLPRVMDDDGTLYADNVYHLQIQTSGRTVLDRRFTKRHFASLLSAEVRQKGLLDGMMYDATLPGLCFAVSVSLPQSDLLDPLLLYVDDQGGTRIERDQRSENDFEFEDER